MNAIERRLKRWQNKKNKKKTKQPAYDLRPLIEAIKTSSAAHIQDALIINPNRTQACNTKRYFISQYFVW